MIDDNYLETYYEVVCLIEENIDTVQDLYDKKFEEFGYCHKYDIAKDITNRFEESYRGYEWDGDWLEVLEDFVLSEIYKLNN